MVNINDVLKANERIKDVLYPTDMFYNEKINFITGQKVYLKTENFQYTGSFKYRGAYNFISNLVYESGQYTKNGVIADSSGNHAIAVASITNKFKIPSMLCIPHDAPVSKKEKIQKYNNNIIFYDSNLQNRTELTIKTANEYNLTIIPSSNHELIMAGAGTIGIEMIEENNELDAIIAPVGGGGLLAGVSIAVHSFKPKLKIFGVEPDKGNDTFLSMERGKIVQIPVPGTIADGLKHTQPNTLTFPIIQKNVEEIITVSEEEIISAMFFSKKELNIILEPSGAVALAAVLFNKIPHSYKNIGVILSGGNIDYNLKKYLEEGLFTSVLDIVR